MFLRNAWYAAGWSRDFAAAITSMSILNEGLILYRDDDGRPVAMEDRCPHRLAPLSLGRREGDAVRCMYHGLLFGPDGHCRFLPGQELIPPAIHVRTYPAIDRHSVLWLWMGDKALADEALIPPFVGVDSPDWAMRPGRLDYRANYELVNDNLLDLSHVAWVHAQSFAGGDPAAQQEWASAPVKVVGIDRGVRVSRWIEGGAGPPFTRHLTGPLVDMHVSYDFIVPGIFLLHSQAFMPGTAARYLGEAPQEPPVHARFTCQAVTPLTETETCYFFGFGPWREHAEHEPIFYEMGLKAFNEDRVMIEAQQRVIDRDPARRMAPIAIDAATTRFRGIMRRLMREEQGTTTPIAVPAE